MAIGARDRIDQLLVKKYAQERVDNQEMLTSMVNPEKMLNAMDDYANMHKSMFELSQKLDKACSRVNAKNARYMTNTVFNTQVR